MKLSYKGYWIADPKPTGGKAGKGRAITTSIQVQVLVFGGLVIKKNIRYRSNSTIARATAIEKAVAFIDAQGSVIEQSILT